MEDAKKVWKHRATIGLAVLSVIFLVITLKSAAAINLYNCSQQPNQIGGYYVMQQDINPGDFNAGLCYSGVAANVTINCDGHTITPNPTSNTFIPVPSSAQNFELENCIFHVGDSAHLTVLGFNTGTYNTMAIINSEFILNGSHSLYLLSISPDAGGSKITNAVIEDNTFRNTSAYVLTGNILLHGDSFRSPNSNISGYVIKNNNVSVRAGITQTGNFAGGQIYNNFFLNATNVGNTLTALNISPVGAYNIMGGIMLGGNFWADSAGMGYSEICDDEDANGLCDNTPYYPTGSPPGDYAPLSARQPTAATCDSSAGCFLYETFSYNDYIVYHGWNGNWVSYAPSIYPEDAGEYECIGAAVASYPYLWHGFSGDLTPANGVATLKFKSQMCGDPSAGVNVWLGSGSTNAASFWLWGNNVSLMASQGDHSTILWDDSLHGWVPNVTDTYGLCLGLPLWKVNVTVIYRLAQTPRTFDVYVNNHLVGANIDFSGDGQTVAGFNYLYFQGDYVGAKCWWTLDNIEMSASIPTGSTGGTYGEFGNYTGTTQTINTLGISSDGFDWSRCRVGENPNICVLRVMFGGALGWVVNLVLDNILYVLVIVVILLLLGLAFARAKGYIGG